MSSFPTAPPQESPQGISFERSVSRLVPAKECIDFFGDNSTHVNGPPDPWKPAIAIIYAIGRDEEYHYTVRPLRLSDDQEALEGLLQKHKEESEDTSRPESSSDATAKLDLEPYAPENGGAMLVACHILSDGMSRLESGVVNHIDEVPEDAWTKGRGPVDGAQMVVGSGEDKRSVNFRNVPRAVLQEVLAGCCCLKSFSGEGADGLVSGEVDFLYVVERERELRVDELLIGSILSVAKENGFEQIFVGEANRGAHEMLKESYGFQAVQRGDRVILRRDLHDWTGPVFLND